MRKNWLAVACLPIASVFVFALGCFGQVATGTPPYGSFGGGPDVINLANLNAHLTVPVLNKAGRGMAFNYNLAYDSSIWVPVTSGGTTTWQPAINYGWNADTQAPLGHLGFTTVVTICNVNRVPGESIVSTNYAYQDSWGAAHKFIGTRTIKTGSCDLTGVFCTSRGEREFTRRTAGHAQQEVQSGTDRNVAAAD
jgi:hypothetical protein